MALVTCVVFRSLTVKWYRGRGTPLFQNPLESTMEQLAECLLGLFLNRCSSIIISQSGYECTRFTWEWSQLTPILMNIDLCHLKSALSTYSTHKFSSWYSFMLEALFFRDNWTLAICIRDWFNRFSIKMPVECLVCGKPTSATHMGMDACRACTVFYK